MTTIAIATCAALPDGDEDAPLLREALGRQGLQPSWQIWDDPNLDWARFELVVIRSTWDYTARRDEFLAWAASLRHVRNPIELLAWNTDKTYLGELVERGVPVVPTTWAAPGQPLELPSGQFVLKPSVGAGSMGAGRFDESTHAEAHRHAERLHAAGRTVMVQPYLAQVDEAGETALVYVAGRFSHAVRKGPMLPAGSVNPLERDRDLYVREHITPRVPSAGELDVGARALAAIGARFGALPLYARVDLLPTPDGPVVVELELAEPSLFLVYHPAAADTLARAIAASVRGGSSAA